MRGREGVIGAIFGAERKRFYKAAPNDEHALEGTVARMKDGLGDGASGRSGPGPVIQFGSALRGSMMSCACTVEPDFGATC